ncbi:MAG: FIST N-terminal domain-containing protein [Phycisphaerae bacterium]
MRFACSVSDEGNAERAVDELLGPIDSRVTPGMVDLVLLHATAHFDDELPAVLHRLGETFAGAVLLGCTAEGTIGAGRELERVPSMSLLVGTLPDVTVRPFYLQQPELKANRTTADWERTVGASPEAAPVFIALADPFRFAVHDFVERINEAYVGAPLVGGVASAAAMPGQNRLLLNGEIYTDGLVGVALTGRLRVDTVVSQGCRPVGQPYVITRGERNIILDLGGKAPLEQLQHLLGGLSEDDARLARESLLIGRVIDEYRDRFARGDFLIHNILGVDKKSGAMAIAGQVRVGSTVQFHVRDADSADEDLRSLLARHSGGDHRGAMLFGCNGRGTRMWKTPGHDVGVLREALGDLPVAGFFCGGEFGPVGGRNFVHGFTASIALLGPADDTKAATHGTPAAEG